MVTKLEFNFFYSKDSSIKKIIVDDLETNRIAEFFFKALKSFNMENPDCTIVEETQYYKLKLSKKNGKPDFDLPAISPELVAKDSNWTSFSISLDKDHFMEGAPETINKESNMNETTNSKNNSTFASNQVQENKISSVEINENQGGLCCCLTACFKKKK